MLFLITTLEILLYWSSSYIHDGWFSHIHTRQLRFSFVLLLLSTFHGGSVRVILGKCHLEPGAEGMVVLITGSRRVFNMKGLKCGTEVRTDLTFWSAAGMNVCLMVDRKLTQIRPLPPAYTYTFPSLFLPLLLCTYLLSLSISLSLWATLWAHIPCQHLSGKLS